MNHSSAYVKDEYWNKFYYQIRAFIIGMVVGMFYCVAERWDISVVLTNLRYSGNMNYIFSSVLFGIFFMIIYTAAVFVIPWFNNRSENIKVIMVVLFPITFIVSFIIGLLAFIPYTLYCLFRAYV